MRDGAIGFEANRITSIDSNGRCDGIRLGIIAAHVGARYIRDLGHNRLFKSVRKKQTDAFLIAVFPTVLGLVKHAPLRLISGMLGLLFDGGNVLTIARTKVC